MEKLQRRRETRLVRMNEIRFSRFLADYVKAKYNHIHMEAVHVFNDISEKNPGKKDMRKTIEFLKMTTQYTSYNQYYARRKESSDSGPGTVPISNDNMVLNITLMSREEAEKQHEIPSSDFPEAEKQHEIPSSDFPEAEKQHEIPSSDFPEAETEGEITQMVIPQDVYEGLLEELRSDPDLYRLFNDFPDSETQQVDIETQQVDIETRQVDIPVDIPDNETQQGDSNDDMWDAYSIDNEQTPLERELSLLGF